jgi:hypothetical protein
MIPADIFPVIKDAKRAKWAPVVLQPVPGSPERFVVGCLVADGASSHLEFANSLDRLSCLYGEKADSLLMALKYAEQSLRVDLTQRKFSEFDSSILPLAGLQFGEVREGVGADLSDIGRSWMSVMSSFHTVPTKVDVVLPTAESTAMTGERKAAALPLPILILDDIASKRFDLIHYFSERLRTKRGTKTKKRQFGVNIDFSGRKLVANFASLETSKMTASVGSMQQRLWELKVERDRNNQGNVVKQHELIVRVPTEIELNGEQWRLENVREAIGELVRQADMEELRLRPFPSTSAISAHILALEAA